MKGNNRVELTEQDLNKLKQAVVNEANAMLAKLDAAIACFHTPPSAEPCPDKPPDTQPA